MSNDYANPRCTICGSLLHFTDQHPEDGTGLSRGQRRIAAGGPAPRPDGPGAPAPNPSPRGRTVAQGLPTTRTAAPVEEQISDILAITGQQVARFKGRTDLLNLRDLQSLEALVRTVKLAHELDKEVRAALEEELGVQGDEALQARLDELSRKAKGAGV